MKSKFPKMYYTGSNNQGYVMIDQEKCNAGVISGHETDRLIEVNPRSNFGHLFAAAPEMYDALVAIERATTPGQSVTEDEMFELRKQIAAALAKADGGEYK